MSKLNYPLNLWSFTNIYIHKLSVQAMDKYPKMVKMSRSKTPVCLYSDIT